MSISDRGFDGSGSRFVSRFGVGEPITAKQLNDMAQAIQVGLPMPYLGEGPAVSFLPGGSTITYVPDVYQAVAGATKCPSEIYNLRYDVTADVYYINIYPFYVNNMIVTDHDDNPLTDDPPPNIQVFVDGISQDSENPSINYIYVVCEASDATAEADYPVSDPPPYIVVKTDPQSDTDEVAYLMLGRVTGWSDPETGQDTLVIQNLKGCGSVTTARLKCGSGSATYFWSSV
jgi:hypothetical protein